VLSADDQARGSVSRQPVSLRHVTHDGVALAFAEAGAGAPPVVLVGHSLGGAVAYARVDALTRHAMVGVFEAAGRWDAEPALRASRMPLPYVDSGSNLADLDRLAALCPKVEVGRTVGVGHSQMLASPAQVAAMIDRFVSVRAPVLAGAPH